MASTSTTTSIRIRRPTRRQEDRLSRTRATYARYRKSGGKLSKDDWRRDNVDLARRGAVQAACTRRSRGCRSASARSASGVRAIRRRSRASTRTPRSTPTRRSGCRTGGPTISRRSSTGRSRRRRRAFRCSTIGGLHRTRRSRHMWPGLATYRIAEKSARTITRAGDRRRDRHDARARSRSRPHSLQYVGAHEGRRTASPRSSRRVTRRSGARAGVAVAWRRRSRVAPTVTLARDAATDEPTIDAHAGAGRDACGCGPCAR